MEENPYPFHLKNLDARYEFDSVSNEKIVHKAVTFTQIPVSGFYNLALLDILADGKESDMAVSDNQDLPTILATVIKIVEEFLNKFPEKIVTFKGSDNRRTRLYRIVISKEIDKIQEKFIVLGLLEDGEYELFKINQNYRAFLIIKKHN
jgi:hypothetical protein